MAGVGRFPCHHPIPVGQGAGKVARPMACKSAFLMSIHTIGLERDLAIEVAKSICIFAQLAEGISAFVESGDEIRLDRDRDVEILHRLLILMLLIESVSAAMEEPGLHRRIFLGSNRL